MPKPLFILGRLSALEKILLPGLETLSITFITGFPRLYFRSIASSDLLSFSVILKSRIKMAGVILDTADNLIIKISGDNGLIGWGEASSAPTMTGEFVEGMVSAAKFLKSMVVGSDIKNLADIKVFINVIFPSFFIKGLSLINKVI